MPINEPGSVTLQTATGTGNGTPLDLEGYDNATLQTSGPFIGTVTWEATIDGTNWLAVALIDLGSTTRARATTATVPGLYLFDDARGVQTLRARVSAYTSGTITVTGLASG